MKTKDHRGPRGSTKYRNPVARQLHEDRAFRLRVRSVKKIPHVEEVSVNEATILMEEENTNDES